MSQVTIYGLIDPRNDQIKYIGQSVDTKARLQVHCSNGKYQEGVIKAAWIDELRKLGLKPDLIELEITTLEQARDAEIFYIQYFKMLGAELTNQIYYRKPGKRVVIEPPKEYKAVGLRLPKTMYEQLLNLAKKDHRSMNNEILVLVKQAIERSNGQAA